MSGWTVVCAACGLHWTRTGKCTEYERQAIESRPCPGCGGYTLACRDARAAERTPTRRRPESHHRRAA